MTTARHERGRGGGAQVAVQRQLRGAAPTPAPAVDPAAAGARHDGSATTPLGEGDEVWDADCHVIVAFAGTAAGVVEAAFYELHRGDPRSLAEILRDDTMARTTPGVRAGVEGVSDGVGTNTDPEHTPAIAHHERVTQRGARTIRHVTACGPVECYLRSAGAAAGTAWCGSFATFVYLRCGIIGDSMAWSHNVPNVMARLGMEHDASTGHVGIIVGVHRTAEEITLVTIEGNSNNQVRTRTRMIRVTPASPDGHGAAAQARVTSDIKGWGRPPALHASARAPEGGELPAWMAAAARQPAGSRTDLRVPERPTSIADWRSSWSATRRAPSRVGHGRWRAGEATRSGGGCVWRAGRRR